MAIEHEEKGKRALMSTFLSVDRALLIVESALLMSFFSTLVQE